jgi:hypothetical protein
MHFRVNKVMNVNSTQPIMIWSNMHPSCSQECALKIFYKICRIWLAQKCARVLYIGGLKANTSFLVPYWY